jgi:hypothetical protein
MGTQRNILSLFSKLRLYLYRVTRTKRNSNFEKKYLNTINGFALQKSISCNIMHIYSAAKRKKTNMDPKVAGSSQAKEMDF